MSCLQLRILLHYYSLVEDFPEQSFAVDEAIHRLQVSLLLAPCAPSSTPRFTITERGRVHVDALRALALPVKQWVSPASTRSI